ncbi:MAG: cell wall-active antibiotics response protein [Bacteroidetes bacterium]|jgi:predicted membrane protein|nr:cell wall-active antibiotics response protein [Bacteroidota bacterium]
METNSEYKNDHRVFRPEHRHHLSNNKAIIGVILVLVGVFLVIRNAGFFPDFIDNVVFSWPMLLVVIGLILTIGATEKTAGIIVMSVGAFFMIPLVFRETFHMYNMFWPSIFIIIGIIFIVTQRKGWDRSSREMGSDDFIDYVNIFSGGERQIVSQNFRGGKITAVFGGTELDLTKAKLAPGRNDIEIACVFGGATIIVPDSWFVTIEVTPILGGFSDSRKLSHDRDYDKSSQLVIKGAVVFGGGEVKSY